MRSCTSVLFSILVSIQAEFNHVRALQIIFYWVGIGSNQFHAGKPLSKNQQEKRKNFISHHNYPNREYNA